jgi:HD-like signal output (HDOD) protein
MDIKSLLDQPGKLPTIPKISQQLIDSFSSEDVTVDEIANLIAADPALSAKLLRLANSAYFHVSRTIGTVDDALRMLGFVMVRNLVLGNSMVNSFRNTQGMDLNEFWLYHIYTASAARWLAGAEGANTDLVFTVGIMHGIGQLQMHAVMPEVMAPIDKKMHVLDAGRAELEKKTLGFHHGDVAAALAKLWNFPQPIVAALRGIPDPLSAEEFSEPAAWVHLGAWRARTELQGASDAELLASYPKAVGKRLGIAPAWLPALAAESPWQTTPVMPPLKELAEGLDAMLS